MLPLALGRARRETQPALQDIIADAVRPSVRPFHPERPYAEVRAGAAAVIRLGGFLRVG